MNKKIHVSLLAIILWTICGPANAADGTKHNGAVGESVDSVDNWGAWELGVEPSAGPQPVTGQAINVRTPDVRFRPNDNARYRPAGIEQVQNQPPPGMPPAPLPSIPPGTAQGQPGNPLPSGDPRSR